MRYDISICCPTCKRPLDATGPLSATEAAKHLEIPRSTFYALKRTGVFRDCIASRPLGNRKYVPELLDKLKVGESPLRLVHRRRA